jgi:flagellar FliL protein
MAAAAPAADMPEPDAAEAAEPAKTSSRLRRLAMLAIPLLLAGLLAGLWFSGILPSALGLRHAQKSEAAPSAPPVYLDLPEIIANLNGSAQRPSYVKLNVRLELARAQDAERIRQVMPRIQDMLQTYLREMRPEELRGSAGSYRLREELLARANIAVAPAHINAVLFIQMLIQ